MKKAIIIGFVFTVLNSFGQFNSTIWKLNHNNNTVNLTLKQDGNNVFTKSNKFSAKWIEKENKILGRFTHQNKIYKFEGNFKNPRLKKMIIGKCWTYRVLRTSVGRRIFKGDKKRFTLIKKEKNRNVVNTANKIKLLNQKNNLEGKYRVTITKLYTRILENHLLGVFDETAEVYGTIGIRMRGEGRSGTVDIRSIGEKKPRIFDVSKNNPRDIKQKDKIKLKDPTGNVFTSFGALEIDKIREFSIKGEVANEKIIVNIQANISEGNTISDIKFGWKQRSLYLKNLQLGKEYLLVNDKNVKFGIAIGFIVEKI